MQRPDERVTALVNGDVRMLRSKSQDLGCDAMGRTEMLVGRRLFCESQKLQGRS